MSFGGRQSFGRGRGGPTPSRKKKKAPTYSFPILNSEDIVECMSELGIEMVEKDVTHPKQVAVQEVYTKLTEYCMGVTAEELSQGKFAGLSALSYPELHEQSVPKISFWRTVSKLMSAAQVPDFSFMHDVIKPNGERYVRNLSAIINFAKFREERVQHYTEMTASTEALMEEKQQLLREQAKLQDKIASMKEQQEKDKQEIVDIEIENVELSEKVGQVSDKEGQLKHDVGKLANEIKAVQSNVQATKFKILGAREECEQLQNQVISSPDRIKGELAEMQQRVINQRKEFSAESMKLKEEEAKQATVAKLTEDMDKIMGLLDTANGSIAAFKVAKKARQAAEKTIKESEGEEKELKAREANQENAASSLREKLKKARQDRMAKEAASQQCLEEAQRDYQELLQNRTVSQKEKDRLNSEIRRLKEETGMMQVRFEDEKEQAIGMFKKLENSVGNYHKRLFADKTNGNNSADFSSFSSLGKSQQKQFARYDSMDSDSDIDSEGVGQKVSPLKFDKVHPAM
eukprot:g7582.t1